MANPSPAITFTVDLTPLMSETIGSVTHEVTVGIPVLDSTANARRSSWLPSITVSPNRVLRHGDSFTEYGQAAVYLRDMYAVGYAPADRAYLTVTLVA